MRNKGTGIATLNAGSLPHGDEPRHALLHGHWPLEQRIMRNKLLPHLLESGELFLRR